MKIAIVGAGAMGSLFGALLAEAGEEVLLVDVWKEHVDVINRQGLTVSSSEGERSVFLKATIDPPGIETADMAIIFVKSYDTGTAALTASRLLSSAGVAITFQNGVGNIELIEAIVGKGRVLGGTTGFGANLVGPGHITYAGSENTIIGELDGKVSPRLKMIQDVFSRAGLRPVVTENVFGEVWSKLMVNVGLNALTTIARVKNGRVLEVPELTELMVNVVQEAMLVAEKRGIKLMYADTVAHVKQLIRATAENISSMRQDIERGRKTEIDVINGTIVREGATLGVPTPINNVLTLLIKAIEKQHARDEV